jgi:hypothetical protein
MINQVMKLKDQQKKLPNNLILLVMEYLKPNKVGQCLLLNKTIHSILSRKFYTEFFSVKNSTNVTIKREDIKQEMLMKNLKITINIKHENKKSYLFMLQICKNEKERLGVVPLLYIKSKQAYVLNINENRYSSLFFLLRSRNFKKMKFNLELINCTANEISSKEITLSILYFNDTTEYQR